MSTFRSISRWNIKENIDENMDEDLQVLGSLLLRPLPKNPNTKRFSLITGVCLSQTPKKKKKIFLDSQF